MNRSRRSRRSYLYTVPVVRMDPPIIAVLGVCVLPAIIALIAMAVMP